MDPEGNTYERSAIEEWLRRSAGHSPITRSPLRIDQLVPNRALKAAIDDERTNLPSSRPDGATPLDPDAILEVSSPEVPDLLLEVISVPKNKIIISNGAIADNESFAMASVVAPASMARIPTDIVVCIDTSGSMGMLASAEGVESSGLNMLDIVKHAVKTIIKTLNDDDRLGIVGYSNNATRWLELTPMHAPGRDKAVEALNKLEDGGMTNLWDGLKNCMEMLYERDGGTIFTNVPSNTRNSAIYLLTDGVPNVDPPRGYIGTLQRMKDQHGGKYPGVLSTFGFGYNLKSDLLLSLAQEGQGTYAFIPDSGFVGTVFVNALGNTLTTSSNDCTVSISTEKSAAKILSHCDNDIQTQSSEDSIIFKGRSMHIGVPWGSVFEVNDNELPLVMAHVKYVKSANQEQHETTMTGPITTANEIDVQEIAAEYYRGITINTISKVIELCNENSYEEATTIIRNVIQDINAWLDNTTDCGPKHIMGETKVSVSARLRIIGLKDDLEGQISEASSKIEWYTKWGAHFLRSIMRAHQLKHCNNFKDPGVQYYGNTEFVKVRDDADDIFSALPPPTKSTISPNMARFGYGGGGTQPTAIVDMSAYNDRSRGCFHGNSIVTLSNGSTKLASSIVRGDMLNSGGKVKCVIKTFCDGKMQLIRLPMSGLLITPYHPVFINDKWEFPINIGEWVEVDCNAVYSYIVESGTISGKYATSALINGISTAMLAHGVEGIQCLSHPFFGTNKFIDAIKQCSGYDHGLVVFNDGGYFTRDINTNDVCGIDATMAIVA